MPRTLCSIDGCEKRARAAGLCSGHHYRWKRHGDPLGGRRFKAPPLKGTYAAAKAFENAARAYEGDDCVIWPFAKINGYARRTEAGVTVLIARKFCIEVNGPPPEGKPQSQHRCGVKACINKRHVKWGNQSDNEADKKLHGTYYTGLRASGVRAA
jgi:hypothetical protein